MIATARFQRRVGGYWLPGLRDPVFCAEHQSRLHQRLRACAAFREPTLNKHLIDPTSFAHNSFLVMKAKGASVQYREMKPVHLQLAAGMAAIFALGISATGAQQQDRNVTQEQTQTDDKNWLEAPQTPGDWTYATDGTETFAVFGEGPERPRVIVRCDQGTRKIVVGRFAQAGPEITMRVRTETVERVLVALSQKSRTPLVATEFEAHDPLLDAMAITLGRFAIEIDGMEPLYVPAWAEVTRVIEDCR